MNQCPKCGKVSEMQSSILPGCMCEWSGIFDPQAMKEGKDFTISKPWVGLTDEEIMEPWPFENRLAFARWLEAKLKEKNT